MICNLIFRRWALLSCSIPKNQCKSALSFHSFSESFLHLWRERKNEAQWCVLKMKQNLYQTREILFFKKKNKNKLPTWSLFPPNIIRVHTQLRILQRNTSKFCYILCKQKLKISFFYFSFRVSILYIFLHNKYPGILCWHRLGCSLGVKIKLHDMKNRKFFKHKIEILHFF